MPCFWWQRSRIWDMGQKSTIARLDPRLKEAVDRAVREGRATIDEIVARSSLWEARSLARRVGRYVQSGARTMERYREAQEVASVWVRKMEETPDGDVGRLNAELLRTVAFQVLSALGDNDAEVKPNEIMLLARAIKDLASADKTSTDRELRVRREVAQKAAQQAVSAARKGGLSSEQAEDIRREILRIAA